MGNGTFRRKLSDKERECFKHFICNISKGFMIRIFALLYHNYNGNKYVLFISGELIILTMLNNPSDYMSIMWFGGGS